MTTPGRRTLIVAGIAAYLLFVTVSFPAHVAARLFAPESLRLGAPSGTVWNGRAESVAFGDTVAGATEWQLRPLALLRGRLSAELTINFAGGAVVGGAAVTPAGTIYLDNVAGVVPLSMLNSIVPTSTFDGRLGLDLIDARLVDHWLVDAHGTVDLVDLRMISPIEEPLGSYELLFDGADGDTLNGVFRDVQARLGAEGSLVLHRDRRWELDGLISAPAGTRAELTRALAMLGQRDPQGRYRLTLGGEL